MSTVQYCDYTVQVHVRVLCIIGSAIFSVLPSTLTTSVYSFCYRDRSLPVSNVLPTTYRDASREVRSILCTNYWVNSLRYLAVLRYTVQCDEGSLTVSPVFGRSTVEVRPRYSESSFMIRYWCGMDAVRYGTGTVQCVNVLLLPTVEFMKKFEIKPISSAECTCTCVIPEKWKG